MHSQTIPPSAWGSSSKCRFCATDLKHSVVDLGMSPLCQKHITPQHANEAEKFYPLHAYVCHECWLVQLEEFATPDEIFAEDYAYFSSFSDSWLAHCRQYTESMVNRFGFNSSKLVVEIASNDGYLLQWFVEKGIPVLGVEPAANVAQAARQKGIPTEVLFFGAQVAQDLANQYGKADLLLGNNVLAHVPDINDFVGGMKIMLAEEGVITMEFPHLQRLMEGISLIPFTTNIFPICLLSQSTEFSSITASPYLMCRNYQLTAALCAFLDGILKIPPSR
nr:methyltransferase domain-containing protein [Haliscomenobacter sp.]